MDIFGIAASGLHSAEVRLAASANNIANLSTQSYRPLRAVQEEVAIGGSLARIQRATSPGPVNLAREIVEQSRASFQYTASLRVLATGFELRGQLIDLLG